MQIKIKLKGLRDTNCKRKANNWNVVFEAFRGLKQYWPPQNRA